MQTQMTAIHDWPVRQGLEADHGKIIDLVNLVQPHVPYSEERFRWEYLNCPHGKVVVWLCEADHEILSFTAQAPHIWFINGDEKKLFMHIDTMTHPQYRYKGIHAAVVKGAHSHILSSDVMMSYVFPNDQSVRQIRKTNWAQVIRIPLYTRNVSTGLPKEAMAVGYTVREVDSFGPEVNMLQQATAAHFPCIHKRDSDYLNWRFCQKPDERYRIFYALSAGNFAGYMVFKSFRRKGEEPQDHMVDMLVSPNQIKAAEALIRKSIEMSRAAGVDHLSCWANDNGPWERSLKKFGFTKEVIDRYLFISPDRNGRVEKALCDPRNWYLTMGDSDVF